MAFAVPQCFLRDQDGRSPRAAECAAPGDGLSQSTSSPDLSLYETQGDKPAEISLEH